MAAAASKTIAGFKLAAIQMLVGHDKASNVQKALVKIAEAAGNGANLVVLPEFFNAPYGNEHFAPYAECVPDGDTCTQLSAAARKHNIYLVGGSIPEKHDGSLYNTSVTYSPRGELLAKHRKMHLFDIDVPGKITFKESATLSPGNQFTTFDTEWCKVGVGICFDVRFTEMASIYAKQGCKLLIYPGAFNTTTGPAHWLALHRARAIDAQVFCVGCSPAAPDQKMGGYPTWGHSVVVDPWLEIWHTRRAELLKILVATAVVAVAMEINQLQILCADLMTILRRHSERIGETFGVGGNQITLAMDETIEMRQERAAGTEFVKWFNAGNTRYTARWRRDPDNYVGKILVKKRGDASRNGEAKWFNLADFSKEYEQYIEVGKEVLSGNRPPLVQEMNTLQLSSSTVPAGAVPIMGPTAHADMEASNDGGIHMTPSENRGMVRPRPSVESTPSDSDFRQSPKLTRGRGFSFTDPSPNGVNNEGTLVDNLRSDLIDTNSSILISRSFESPVRDLRRAPRLKSKPKINYRDFGAGRLGRSAK